MTVYETILTHGNIKNNHITITPFRDELPADVFGGSTADDVAPRTVRLEFGPLHADTDVPATKKTGKPRTIFRDRTFPPAFFERTHAAPGDTVLFEEVTPYHFRLKLRTAGGKLVEP